MLSSIIRLDSEIFMKKTSFGVLGGALIVAGTSIGAGMLALPVVTGPAGFVPSVCMLITAWAFMTITGLFFAELSLWLGHDANLLTMARKTLGPVGQFFTWVLYLFLFYCLLVAYFVGGGNHLAQVCGPNADHAVRIILFALLFITLVLLGKKFVDPINRLLMIGLLSAYAGFVLIGTPLINASQLVHANWHDAKWALPIAFTSFGFQGTVPTLTSWMSYNRRKIHLAIICGTSLTLGIYLIWEFLFLGIVPVEGPHGLIDTLQAGQDAIHSLQFFTHSATVWALGKAFAFFAIATSFLGVGIGVVDFLADGLGIKKKGVFNYLVLIVAAFGVPLFFALTYPYLFLHALGLAGGFGSAFLLGVLPIVMAWRAKYALEGNLCNRRLLSSRFVMLLLLCFVGFVLVTQLLILFR